VPDPLGAPDPFTLLDEHDLLRSASLGDPGSFTYPGMADRGSRKTYQAGKKIPTENHARPMTPPTVASSLEHRRVCGPGVVGDVQRQHRGLPAVAGSCPGPPSAAAGWQDRAGWPASVTVGEDTFGPS
jgi:hypothetical protein